MNKLSIHHVTDITISREVFDSSANHDGFTVVNITAEDKTGTRTRLTCFVERGCEPLDDMVIETNHIKYPSCTAA
mgnify:CR=1 FL=1|jgi:hypothetical protein|tara:strand:- start:306 stop:530 length:225 start_codon:yes stop_codon:yes gene_type:complete